MSRTNTKHVATPFRSPPLVACAAATAIIAMPSVSMAQYSDYNCGSWGCASLAAYSNALGLVQESIFPNQYPDFWLVRTTINGVYQGQTNAPSLAWMPSVPNNAYVDIEVKPCWNNWPWSANCSDWVDNAVFTFPNNRTFTNQELVRGNKCMDLNESQASNGNRIQLFDCNGSAAQSWTLQADGTIHSGVDPTYCIDDAGFGTANDNPIQIWQCNGKMNQVWSYENNDSFTGYFGRCIDDPGGNLNDWTALETYDCNGTTSQVWYTLNQ